MKNLIDIYDNLKKSLLNYFFGLGKIKYASDDFKKYCEDNFEKWIENALKLRADLPYETSFFWADLIRSNFTLKLFSDAQKFGEKDIDEWTGDEKISFLQMMFESGYYYFAFLNISKEYSPRFLRNIHSEWYNPKVAKEYDRSWRRCKTGKWWVYYHLPFKRFFSGNLSFLKKIRNANSHGDLLVRSGNIYFLKEDETQDITDEVDSLCKFLFDCFNISFQFHFKLLITHYFWLLPSIILLRPNKFNYQRKEPNFKIFEKSEDTKLILEKKPALSAMIKFATSFWNAIETMVDKRKLEEHFAKNNVEVSPWMIVAGIIAIILEFFVNSMWVIFEREKDLINKLLLKANLELSIEGLGKAKEDSFDLISDIITAVDNSIIKFTFEEQPKVFEGKLPINQVIENLMNTFKRVSVEKPRKEYSWLLLSIGLGVFSSMMTPLHSLLKGIDDILVPK